jgi:hypothetical protein
MCSPHSSTRETFPLYLLPSYSSPFEPFFMHLNREQGRVGEKSTKRNEARKFDKFSTISFSTQQHSHKIQL